MEYTSRDVQVRPNYDPRVFIAIPTQDELDSQRSTLEQWASQVTATALTEPQQNESFESQFWNMILQIARIHWSDDSGIEPCWTLLYAPPGDLRLLVLNIFLWDDEGIPAEGAAPTLRSLALADDKHAVEPPIVDVVHNHQLGQGIRTLRYITHPDPHRPDRLMADIHYVFHASTIGIFLEIRTVLSSPPRLLNALEDLDDLARSVEIVCDDKNNP